MRIALVDGSTVLQTWHAPNGEVATRYTLPDGSQISPVSLGWSSGDYAVLEVVPFVAPGGKRIVGAASCEVTGGKVVETFHVEDIPVERRMVPKWKVVQRLTDEQLEAAYALMTLRQQERWRAAAFPDVYADDPETLAVLAAVGSDAEAVMAE